MPHPITAQNVSAARVFPCSFSHLQADTGPRGCGVLQPHVAAYPVGLSRRAQQGTGASCIAMTASANVLDGAIHALDPSPAGR